MRSRPGSLHQQEAAGLQEQLAKPWRPTVKATGLERGLEEDKCDLAPALCCSGLNHCP